MKIMHIMRNLNSGGAEKFVIELCNKLVEEDEVVLCLLNNLRGKDILAPLVDKRIKIVSLGKGGGFSLLTTFKLIKLIRKEQPIVINTHLRPVMYLMPIIKFIKAPVFHTVHNDALKEESSSLLRKMRKLFFKLGLITPITISELSNNSFDQVYGKNIRRKKIEYGVSLPLPSKDLIQVQNEINRLKTTSNTTVFINVGRIAEQKNQIMLAEIFNELYEEGRDVLLIILGGSYKGISEGILEKIETIKAPNTHLLGAKLNVFDYLYSSDAFCLSSKFEGLPISLLESLGAGIIPICTPVGGIPNAITDSVNGFLSTDTSKSQYKKKIIEFLEIDINRRKRISQKATEKYKQEYSIDICAMKYRNTYQETL